MKVLIVDADRWIPLLFRKKTVKSFKYCHFLLKSSIPRYAPLVRAEISRKKDHGNMDKP